MSRHNAPQVPPAVQARISNRTALPTPRPAARGNGGEVLPAVLVGAGILGALWLLLRPRAAAAAEGRELGFGAESGDLGPGGWGFFSGSEADPSADPRLAVPYAYRPRPSTYPYRPGAAYPQLQPTSPGAPGIGDQIANKLVSAVGSTLATKAAGYLQNAVSNIFRPGTSEAGELLAGEEAVETVTGSGEVVTEVGAETGEGLTEAVGGQALQVAPELVAPLSEIAPADLATYTSLLESGVPPHEAALTAFGSGAEAAIQTLATSGISVVAAADLPAYTALIAQGFPPVEAALSAYGAGAAAEVAAPAGAVAGAEVGGTAAAGLPLGVALGALALPAVAFAIGTAVTSHKKRERARDAQARYQNIVTQYGTYSTPGELAAIVRAYGGPGAELAPVIAAAGELARFYLEQALGPDWQTILAQGAVARGLPWYGLGLYGLKWLAPRLIAENRWPTIDELLAASEWEYQQSQPAEGQWTADTGK